MSCSSALSSPRAGIPAFHKSSLFASLLVAAVAIHADPAASQAEAQVAPDSSQSMFAAMPAKAAVLCAWQANSTKAPSTMDYRRSGIPPERYIESHHQDERWLQI